MAQRSFGIAGFLAAVLALVAALVVTAAPSDAAPSSSGTSHASGQAHFERVCASAAPAAAACDALLNTDASHSSHAASPSRRGTTTIRSTTTTTRPTTTTSTTLAPTTTTTLGNNPPPSGYGPADLQSAYGLAAAAAADSSSQTVGIVDAYDDPYAESDLGVYRSQYGLPACTTANGCFKKVNQSGTAGSYPAANASWSEEISLDLDMVSAICPSCRILLVEASSSSFANLGAAENRAVALGATTVSNSWGGSDASDSSYGSYFNHPGVAITASSGDSGYGVEYPASSGYVTAVGGTSLSPNASTARGWTESAWSDAGSGCSGYNAQPTWQASLNTGCSHRAEADVSADADPSTGVAVYDSYAYQGYVGWLVFGGTSVASPVIASVYALAGNATSTVKGSYPYSHDSSSTLNDVTSGSNGSCGTQLCTARTGWDGPTGLGTPSGIGAF